MNVHRICGRKYNMGVINLLIMPSNYVVGGRLRTCTIDTEKGRKILDRTQIIAEQRSKRDREEYNEILRVIPESAPKNLGSYRRMKKAQSERFKCLSKQAMEAGIEIKYI